MSYSDIFPSEIPKSKIIKNRGGYVEVRNTPTGSIVERLFSTDPYAYLAPESTPGKKYNENILSAILK